MNLKIVLIDNIKSSFFTKYKSYNFLKKSENDIGSRLLSFSIVFFIPFSNVYETW